MKHRTIPEIIAEIEEVASLELVASREQRRLDLYAELQQAEALEDLEISLELEELIGV